jgi:hypothetical protein
LFVGVGAMDGRALHHNSMVSPDEWIFKISEYAVRISKPTSQ